MLHVERIFRKKKSFMSLNLYPIDPDGHNWKATMMIDTLIHRCTSQMATMVGIEDKVWIRIAGHAPVYAVADEDLERETSEKTSSVHFLRFELTPDMIQSLRQGATLSMGVDHPAYQAVIDAVDASTRTSLLNDLSVA